MMTQPRRHSSRRPRIRALFVALILTPLLSDHGFAACQYPDVVQALGANANSVGVKIALLAADTTSRDFLAATEGSLDTLRRTDNGLIASVAVESVEDGTGVEQKYGDESHRKYDGVLVLDGEFMKGGSPKYNEVLDFYRDKPLKPSTVMIIDRYLPPRQFPAFVQITAQGSPDSAALLAEAAAAIIAHPGLAWSAQFIRYGSLVSRYAGSATLSQRPRTSDVAKAREMTITGCLGAPGG